MLQRDTKRSIPIAIVFLVLCLWLIRPLLLGKAPLSIIGAGKVPAGEDVQNESEAAIGNGAANGTGNGNGAAAGSGIAADAGTGTGTGTGTGASSGAGSGTDTDTDIGTDLNREFLERLRLNPKAGLTTVILLPSSITNLRPPIGPDIRLVPPDNNENLKPEVPVVKGAYSTGWIAGSKYFDPLIAFIQKTEVNALVVDIKDDTGSTSYQSKVPLAKKINANVSKIKSIENLMETLKSNDIYPIARIVCFKDPLLAKARPDLAVKSKKGGLWYDRQGLAWVDPHNREVWDYAIDLAKEAAALGFKEIQFDYVRFASDGVLSDIIYPYATGQSKAEVIRDFLAYARKELSVYGVILSADVFGLVCSVPDDLGIGQQLELIAEEVDYICPMVYPSHYYRGTYGLENPNAKPYETVYKSLTDAMQRIEGKRAKLRPWLQDFSLGYTYGRAELQAQIKAAKDAGIEEWLFWNPTCRYDASKY